MWSATELVRIASCLLLALFASLYLFFTWHFDFWKKLNVPYVTPVPFLGNFTFLLRKSPSDFFKETYRRFSNEDYYGIWVFRRPALVVRSPEIARKVFVKDFDSFHDRFLSSGTSDPLGSLNIFTAKEPLWSKVRRRLTPVFTSSKLRSLQGLVDSSAVELIDRIRQQHVQLNKPVDLRDLMGCYTTDLIGSAAFGVQCESVRNDDSPMRRLTREIGVFNWRRGLEFSSIFFFPSVIDFFRFKFYPEGMSTYFRQIFWQIADERRNNGNENRSRDLLDALIELKKEGDPDYSDDVLVAQAAIFVQGGFDTTSVILSYTLLELTYATELQQRLYDEIKGAKDAAGGKLDPAVVNELPFLAMCIKETLRKYTPMGFMERIATKDCQLEDKLLLPKGTIVYLNYAGMHYDEKYFPEPLKWDPDRFSDNERHIVPFSYAPFGEGPRNCIGKRFALIALKAAIANILLNFELAPKPGQPLPNDIPTEAHSVFLAPAEKLVVQFVERR